jgi:hypothetical protein
MGLLTLRAVRFAPRSYRTPHAPSGKSYTFQRGIPANVDDEGDYNYLRGLSINVEGGRNIVLFDEGAPVVAAPEKSVSAAEFDALKALVAKPMAERGETVDLDAALVPPAPEPEEPSPTVITSEVLGASGTRGGSRKRGTPSGGD